MVESGAFVVRQWGRVLAVYLVAAGIGALVGLLEAPWVVPLAEPLLDLAPFGVIASTVAGALAGTAVLGLIHGAVVRIGRQVAAGWGVAFLSGGLLALVGAVIGLIGYFILELLFPDTAWISVLEAGLVLALTVVGFGIGFRDVYVFATLVGGGPLVGEARPEDVKVLDTSVIIDGRIEDLVQTGFVEGQLVIPEFVLGELQHIADSSDNLRRRKGRRGLDVLKSLRNDPNLDVEVVDTDYPEINAVDRKLVQLAQDLDAKLVTTDFNLNKVAQVEDVTVLNINRLANAVKPRFIPGEELEVDVIDRGEEIGQGVGYLDDGTMVVVENGRRFIGKTVRATVSSSLQTDAGKMLFVRPKGAVNGGLAESS